VAQGEGSDRPLIQRRQERNSLAKTRPGGPGDDSSLAIVCVDGSPASNEALRFALHHLRTRFVVLAHGIRVPLAFGGPPSTPSRRKDDGTTQDDAEELHRLAEQQYLKSCQEAGVIIIFITAMMMSLFLPSTLL